MQHIYMSFGGGVQSTTLAILAIKRDPRLLRVTGGQVPALYLYADTGDERLVTSEHVEVMREWLVSEGYVFEVLRRPESLSEHVLNRVRDGRRGINLPPVHIAPIRDAHRASSMPVRRGCTSYFKVALLDSYAKRIFKVQRKAGETIEQWYGMSHDEPMRLRTSQDTWRRFAYPLYAMGWTRRRCEEYLAEQTYPDGRPVPVVRSSCVFCPYHSNEAWRDLRDNDPEGWGRALAFDEALRAGGEPIAGLKSLAYVHKGRLPLGQAPLDPPPSDQTPSPQLDLFSVEEEECSGVCGV